MESLFDKKDHKLTDEQLSKIKYANLHQHTTHSLLDGIGHAKEHILESYCKGHQGCAITDHGVMSGVLDMYYSSKDKKFLKSFNYPGERYPVALGSELYILDNTLIRDKKRKYHHITLLAKNAIGYRNLCKLTSLGTSEKNFFTRPRISLEDLFKHKEGLIATSGCFIGYIPQAIFLDKGKAKEVLRKILKNEDLKKELVSILKAPENIIKSSFSPSEKVVLKEMVKDLAFREALEKVLLYKDLQDVILNSKGIPLSSVYICAIQENENLSNKEKNFLLRIISEHTPDELVLKFKEEFKDDFYIEMHLANICMRWNPNSKKHEDQGDNPQEKVNKGLVPLIQKHGVKTIICQDSHMPKKEHHILQSIMIWNSPSGQDGWHFPTAYYTMSIRDMYEKFKKYYPWMSDEQFIEWSNNSMEVLDKCKDIELPFEVSLPNIDYEKHYLNKEVRRINPSLKKILKKHNYWSEAIKQRILKRGNLHQEDLPESAKNYFIKKELVYDLSFDEISRKRIDRCEQVISVLETEFKNNHPEFYELLVESKTDIGLRTALKVIINNQKLYPKKIDRDKLKQKIQQRFPNKSLGDFPGKVLNKIINRYNLYVLDKDPLKIFGEKNYRDRLISELTLIRKNGVSNLLNYFMLLEEVTQHIKEEGFLRGVGRGSGAGSLLAYALDITDVDPIEYDLLFERFLTLERIKSNKLPDIDYDTNGRSAIKDYLIYHYGKDNVSLLGVFNNLRIKGAIQDVTRHMKPDMHKNDVAKLTRAFDVLDKDDYSNEIDFFNATLAQDEELASWFLKNDNIKQLVLQLIGNVRSITTHPVGIVVAGDKIYNRVPCSFDYKKEHMWITQNDVEFVEKAGLIKFDFLNLNILDEISDCLKLIAQHHKKRISLGTIPLNDPLVLKEFCEGQTHSIFQYSTQLATNLLTQIKELENINQLALVTAIARKGPLSRQIDQKFIRLINGEEDVKYTHRLLKPILKESFGLLIYQEQAMKIFQDIGNMSDEESLKLLDLMKKGSEEEILSLKDKFLIHSKDKIGEKNSILLWEDILSFSKYSFNKSHAISYAKLAYCSMWLKFYFKKEWACAVLSSSDKSRFKDLYGAWSTLVKKPDVNYSDVKFSLINNKLYMPLTNVSKMSLRAVDEIKLHRPYTSFIDFYQKVSHTLLNKTVITNLILSGSFDGLKDANTNIFDFRRKTILDFISIYNKNKKPTKQEILKNNEWAKEMSSMSKGQFIMTETELLDIPSFDYFSMYKDQMRVQGQINFGAPAYPPYEIFKHPSGKNIVVGGAVESIRIFTIKRGMNKGKDMAEMHLINQGDRIKVYIFSDDLAWDSSGKNLIRDLKEYTPIIIKGKITEFNGVRSLTYEKGLVIKDE